jgi:lysophospholipase L1-like esterase
VINLKFKTSVDRKSKLKVAVIGDSTAIGQGADTIEGSFSYIYVQEVLSKEYAKIRYLNLGVSGARAIDVIRDQLDEAVKFKPDLIFVSVGANDVTLNTSDEEFRKNVQKITQKIEGIGVEIIWINIPDFIISPILLPPLNMYLSNRSKQLNTILESVLNDRNVHLVDLNKEVKKVFLSQLDKYFSKDMLHPSYEGYKNWAENIRGSKMATD